MKGYYLIIAFFGIKFFLSMAWEAVSMESDTAISARNLI